jgi:hypothetical protein
MSVEEAKKCYATLSEEVFTCPYHQIYLQDDARTSITPKNIFPLMSGHNIYAYSMDLPGLEKVKSLTLYMLCPQDAIPCHTLTKCLIEHLCSAS